MPKGRRVKCKPGSIGDGVEVRPSSIPGAGLGLWTTRPFPKNALFTEYSGAIIAYQQALALAAAGRGSHLRVLELNFRAIKGIKKPQHGKGGASFANDARDPSINNAAFVNRFDQHIGRAKVWLKAKRDLAAGEEVFASYQSHYWLRSNVPPARPGQAPQEQQQQQHEHQGQDSAAAAEGEGGDEEFVPTQVLLALSPEKEARAQRAEQRERLRQQQLEQQHRAARAARKAARAARKAEKQRRRLAKQQRREQRSARKAERQQRTAAKDAAASDVAAAAGAAAGAAAAAAAAGPVTGSKRSRDAVGQQPRPVKRQRATAGLQPAAAATPSPVVHEQHQQQQNQQPGAAGAGSAAVHPAPSDTTSGRPSAIAAAAGAAAAGAEAGLQRKHKQPRKAQPAAAAGRTAAPACSSGAAAAGAVSGSAAARLPNTDKGSSSHRLPVPAAAAAAAAAATTTAGGAPRLVGQPPAHASSSKQAAAQLPQQQQQQQQVSPAGVQAAEVAPRVPRASAAAVAPAGTAAAAAGAVDGGVAAATAGSSSGWQPFYRVGRGKAAWHANLRRALDGAQLEQQYRAAAGCDDGAAAAAEGDAAGQQLGSVQEPLQQLPAAAATAGDAGHVQPREVQQQQQQQAGSAGAVPGEPAAPAAAQLAHAQKQQQPLCTPGSVDCSPAAAGVRSSDSSKSSVTAAALGALNAAFCSTATTPDGSAEQNNGRHDRLPFAAAADALDSPEPGSGASEQSPAAAAAAGVRGGLPTGWQQRTAAAAAAAAAAATGGGLSTGSDSDCSNGVSGGSYGGHEEGRVGRWTQRPQPSLVLGHVKLFLLHARLDLELQGAAWS